MLGDVVLFVGDDVVDTFLDAIFFSIFFEIVDFEFFVGMPGVDVVECQ